MPARTGPVHRDQALALLAVPAEVSLVDDHRTTDLILVVAVGAGLDCCDGIPCAVQVPSGLHCCWHVVQPPRSFSGSPSAYNAITQVSIAQRRILGKQKAEDPRRCWQGSSGWGWEPSDRHVKECLPSVVNEAPHLDDLVAQLAPLLEAGGAGALGYCIAGIGSAVYLVLEILNLDIDGPAAGGRGGC